MGNFWRNEGIGGRVCPGSRLRHPMRRVRRSSGTLIRLGLVVACAVAIVLLVKGLYPADLPESRNPDFIDNVFDNRAVLWAARLLLISAAGVLALGGVFILVSLGVR